MFFQKIGKVFLCFVVLFTFTIGCEKMTNDIIDGTGTDTDDDDPVAVTPGDLPDDDTNPVGNVVFLTGEANEADKWADHPWTFNSATITGDTLTVSVSYGGGCETHEFTLLAEPAFMEDGPFGTAIGISIVHNSNLDMCEAWLTESYDFDLTPIKMKYQEQYKKDAGSVHLAMIADLQIVTFPDGVPTDLIYEFTE